KTGINRMLSMTWVFKSKRFAVCAGYFALLAIIWFVAAQTAEYDVDIQNGYRLWKNDGDRVIIDPQSEVVVGRNITRIGVSGDWIVGCAYFERYFMLNTKTQSVRTKLTAEQFRIESQNAGVHDARVYSPDVWRWIKYVY
ncbi:MAG TPA: hypothetical protein VG711_08070, partial [Phycisphaerales bacterium]|nr:hypothetical protein [Phycisphaerales bacterium]